MNNIVQKNQLEQLQKISNRLYKKIQNRNFRAASFSEKTRLIRKLKRLSASLDALLSSKLKKQLAAIALFLGMMNPVQNANAQAFKPLVQNPFGIVQQTSSELKPNLIDIDGDKDLDLFLGNSDGDILYFQNTGDTLNPVFGMPQTNPFGLINVGNYSAPALADLDGDGDLDILIGEEYGNFYFHQNIGSASNPSFDTLQINPFGLSGVPNVYQVVPQLIDIDSDGDFDLIAGDGDGSMNVFENIGSATAPNFDAIQINPFNFRNLGYYASPAFGDLDEDGDLDLLTGINNGDLIYTLNFDTSSNASAPVFHNLSATNPFGLQNLMAYAAPAFADIDADGDLDLFVGDANGNINFFEYFNSPPTLDSIANKMFCTNDPDTMVTLQLTGITPGGTDKQNLVVRASSSNSTILVKPKVIYQSPNTTADLVFDLATTQKGTAIITVEIDDGQNQNNPIQRSFEVNVDSCTNLSFQAIEQDLAFKIFPNPAKNQINVLLESTKNLGDFNLNVRNVLGQTILSKTILAQSNHFNQRLDVQNLKSGIYFIEVKGITFYQSLKFIIE